MKTKTKVIVIILSAFICVSTIFVALAFSDVYYMMEIDKPSRIVVYYNDFSNNIVFENGTNEYNEVYTLMCKAYRQPTLKAITKSALSKNPKVEVGDIREVNFKGLKVGFVYDNPQAVKSNKDVYLIDGETYWFGSLIFDVVDIDKYQYSSVAIIPPIDNENFELNEYNIEYLAYSNFNDLYNYLYQKF